MPAAGPSMKNNVFMGARQLGSLENNVSKVATWTRVLKNNVFLGSIEDLKPEKHCLQAKK